MSDKNMFVFINEKKRNELDKLIKLSEVDFLEALYELVDMQPFRFEVLGMNRPEVLKVIQYLVENIKRIYVEKGGQEKRFTRQVAIVISSKANMFSIGINSSFFNSYDVIKEKDSNLGCAFCIELLFHNKDTDESKWVLYDRWYNKLYEVKLDVSKYKDTKALNTLLLYACTPANHF